VQLGLSMTTFKCRRVPAGFLPTVCLDEHSSSPIYRQLYDWFRLAILDGRLRPGERVPSTRSLAAELKISRIPVLSAYEQLLAEGYLQTFVGAGTFVARSIPEDVFRPVGQALRRAGRQNRPRRISRHVETAMLVPQFPDTRTLGAFRTCLPALDQFPISIWSSLLARHSRDSSAELMGYGDPMGYEPFRKAIAEYLGAARSLRCEASQVMVVAGSQQGLQISSRVLLDAHNQVWMEEPGYPRARQTLVLEGAIPVPVPVDHEGLDVEEGLRRYPDARAAYITPSHQYPTGVTMSAARRMMLLDWAARTGSWIIEDDYDSEYRFTSRPIASLQGLDLEDRVIYIGTLSKVLFPALRLGYLVVPKDLLGAFRAARGATDIFPTTLFQAALTDFIREGHFARHIRRMRMLYKQRCETLAETIRAKMGAQLEIISADGGMHLAGLLPPGVDDMAVSRKAAGIGLCANPLSTCYLERPPRGGLILGYGATDTDQIKEGVRRLATIVREVASAANCQMSEPPEHGMSVASESHADATARQEGQCSMSLNSK
jgi:GntR family transcriptional regulator/MocR family aminotransferase